MIKKIVFIILFCLLIGASYYFVLTSKNSEPDSSTPSLNTPTNLQQKPDTIETVSPTSTPNTSTSSDYQFNYIIVRPTDIIELYSNLEDKLTSTEARNRYGCNNLVSSGFYTTDFKHLGLFVIDGEIFSNQTSSKLFNGYFYIDEEGRATVDSFEPTNLTKTRIAVQAGPLIMSDGFTNNIESSNDPARRILVAKSTRDEIIFISIHTKNNPISGPSLKELPRIFENINRTTSLKIADALNLDGGAHSVFVTQTVNLSELSTVGGFFCIKSG